MMNDVYLAIYTNKVKEYCDRAFFANLQEIINHSELTGMVVDNSADLEYSEKLTTLTSLPVFHIEIPKQDFQFQHNVIDSLNVLRNEFLKSDCKYFFIIETDVIPPTRIIEYFKHYFTVLKSEKPIRIIGAYYYKGFHKFLNEPEKTHHCLSGCTMYSRELIEKYPFRIDLEANAGAFPDAWICYDSGADFDYYNIPIICRHISKPSGMRGAELLNKE